MGVAVLMGRTQHLVLLGLHLATVPVLSSDLPKPQLVILGQTGTGKSTLSNILERLQKDIKQTQLATDDVKSDINILNLKTTNMDNKIEKNQKSIERNQNSIEGNGKTIKSQGQSIQANKNSIERNQNSIEGNVKSIKSQGKSIQANKNAIAATQANILGMHVAPLGTITAWVNRPNIDGPHTQNLPTGWIRCDGSVIPQPSPWAGQKTPNINGENRFLRGGMDGVMLQTQDDSIQSHTHSVTDPGHAHGYIDKWPSCAYFEKIHQDGIAGPKDCDKSRDRYDQSHASTSKRSFSGVKVTGVQGARFDSETRPKNMRVVHIMRVF